MACQKFIASFCRQLFLNDCSPCSWLPTGQPRSCRDRCRKVDFPRSLLRSVLRNFRFDRQKDDKSVSSFAFRECTRFSWRKCSYSFRFSVSVFPGTANRSQNQLQQHALIIRNKLTYTKNNITKIKRLIINNINHE